MSDNKIAREALATKVRFLYRAARRFQGDDPNGRERGWTDDNRYASDYIAANAEYHKLYGEYAV